MQRWRQGEYSNVEEIASKFVKVKETIDPDPDLAAKYEEKYQKFRQIYPALKPVYKIL